jgi:hypothetical protein
VSRVSKRKSTGVGVSAKPSVVAVEDSSPSASAGVDSDAGKEAFAHALSVATNKHQELAALRLADLASKARAERNALLAAIEEHRGCDIAGEEVVVRLARTQAKALVAKPSERAPGNFVTARQKIRAALATPQKFSRDAALYRVADEVRNG